MSTNEPSRLESVWERAVRRASAVPPIAAIHPVAVVPTFAPNSTAIATSYVMSPCVARAIAMAIVAADDWITAVMSTATKATEPTPTMESADRCVNTPAKSGFSRMGATPFDMK